MIPKIIHYCWFGRNPKPELAYRCIESWKKHCPDYEIREWNEDNFDIVAAPLYVRQAYEAGKWAFVTDYVRLWAMTAFGGIYMDTDVEVLKPLDPFLHHRAFSGFENATDIPTGIMACEKDFPLFQTLLCYYDDAVFFLPDGTVNLVTNVVTITKLCLEKGLVQNNTYQEIDGFALYPKEYFCPISYMTNQMEQTENTVTIHWFSGSWKDDKIRAEEYARGRRLTMRHNLIHIPHRILHAILGEHGYEKLKSMLKKSK